MPSREIEVAAFLRADATLVGMLTGGVYAESSLPEPGITDAVGTPAIWTGGTFHHCAVVRERMPVPDYLIQDEAAQLTSQAQNIEIYVYSRVAANLETAHDRIYVLMQEHRFTAAWGARWWGGVSNMRAPELPNVFVAQRTYRIVSLKQAA